MKRNRLQVQAHRIFGGEDNQNSISAIQKAANSRLDSIETDVWFSKDNDIIIIHGDTDFGQCKLKPIKESDAAFEDVFIGDLTSEEIQMRTSAELKGTPIPTLSDLLKIFKGTNKIINIEVKELDPKIIPMIINQFESYDMVDQLFLSSFYHYHRKTALTYCREKNLKIIPFGFLSYSIFDTTSEGLLRLAVPGDSLTFSYSGLRRYERVYREFFESANNSCININVWFDGISSLSLETEDNYKTLYDMNIHTVITNHPSIALEIISKITC